MRVYSWNQCRLASESVFSKLMYPCFLIFQGCSKENCRRQVGMQQWASLYRSRLHPYNEVICSDTGRSFSMKFDDGCILLVLFFIFWRHWQVDAMKRTLEKFYGKDPLESADLSRIVNSNHFKRLMSLLDDENVSGTIVYGGQRDEQHL